MVPAGSGMLLSTAALAAAHSSSAMVWSLLLLLLALFSKLARLLEWGGAISVSPVSNINLLGRCSSGDTSDDAIDAVLSR